MRLLSATALVWMLVAELCAGAIVGMVRAKLFQEMMTPLIPRVVVADAKLLDIVRALLFILVKMVQTIENDLDAGLVRWELLANLLLEIRLEELPSTERVPQVQRFALMTLYAIVQRTPSHMAVGQRFGHRNSDLLRGVVRLGLPRLQLSTEVIPEGALSKSSLSQSSGSGGQQKGNRERRVLHF